MRSSIPVLATIIVAGVAACDRPPAAVGAQRAVYARADRPRAADVWAAAARLPACEVPALDTSAWPRQRVPGTDLSLRIPPAYRLDEGPVPPGETTRSWRRADGAVLSVMPDGIVGATLTVEPSGPVVVSRRECGMRLVGYPAAIRRGAYALAGARDTLFGAAVDVPLDATVQLGAAVLHPSAAGRDSLVLTLATLARAAPETTR